MSDNLTGSIDAGNPYQSWNFKDEPYSAELAPPAGYRPGGLTAVCIIAIVLGILGFGTGAISLASNLASNQIQKLQTKWGTAGAPPGMRDVQAEMNAKTMAIVNRFRLVNLFIALSQLILTAALVIGGIRALKLNEMGRKILCVACGLAILFEVTRAVPTVFMQLENMALMEDYIPRMMEASTPGSQGAQVAEFGRMMARFSMIMGWVVLFGWLFLKLAFFGSAFYYLRGPKTKALYATSGTAHKRA
jgi:hypothetical protein